MVVQVKFSTCRFLLDGNGVEAILEINDGGEGFTARAYGDDFQLAYRRAMANAEEEAARRASAQRKANLRRLVRPVGSES